MERIERLFLDTMSDLAARTRSTDQYTVLGCSALIRKLLFDSAPLVDQVNSLHRLRLEFEVTRPFKFSANVPAPMFTSAQDGIDPDTAPGDWARVRLGKDALYAYTLITVHNREYSLRDIVQFEANVMGGVHAGSAREEKERVLEQFSATFSIDGLRTSLRQLLGISRVVLKGLDPLRQAVMQKADT